LGFGGSPRVTAPKRGNFLSSTDMYHHANFTVIGVAVDEISVTGPADREKTATNIPFHTNVWQVIATSEC